MAVNLDLILHPRVLITLLRPASSQRLPLSTVLRACDADEQRCKNQPMTKPELSASEMEAISAGFGCSSRPRFGKLIVLLLALLLRRATALASKSQRRNEGIIFGPTVCKVSRGNCLMALRSDFI
jgi:hypothetical protein